MTPSSSPRAEPGRASSADPPPVQIWRLRLSSLDAPVDALRPLTVPSERARAQRYRLDADRHRHLAGRGLVRLFAARTYGCTPQALSIREGPHGKPHLETPSELPPSLEFNIAHTEDIVVAAFSRSEPVGIDVEPLDRDADLEALSQQVFTDAERAHWQTLPDEDRPRFFFRVWTCKEAFLKATGRGLQRAPDTVECIIDGDTVTGLRDAPGGQSSASDAAALWALRSGPICDRILAAVVRDGPLPGPLSVADAGGLVTQYSSP